MNTAVALMVFNRPDTTRRVFAEIARAKPRKLLVVADGPRPDVTSDSDLCEETRAVTLQVDWDCEVVTNFSDTNLGCRDRVASGLDWVFEQVEDAIILEDDCLPHPSFFPYCEELLQRYRNDERIMAISGDCFVTGGVSSAYSYHFTRYFHGWGWATWRDRWSSIDLHIREWERLRGTGWLHKILAEKHAEAYWGEVFDAVYSGKITSAWDYQFLFAGWLRNMFSIGPNVNLVSNLGFGGTATHTAAHNPVVAALPTSDIPFPLKHPPNVVRDHEVDRYMNREIWKCGEGRNWRSKLKRRLSELRRAAG